MITAYIGLGANLGDPQATLQQAADLLAATPGISGLELSRFYRSAPIESSGPDYINAVARIRTNLDAHALLDALQNTENQWGRTRPYRNAPRTLDLDLLLYGNEVIATARLTVPHPRMHERAFVLKPLAELAPGLNLSQGGIQALLSACADQDIEAV